jgi:hypothetical protein
MWSSHKWKAPFVLILLMLLGVPAGSQSGKTSDDISDRYVLPKEDDSDWWSRFKSDSLEVTRVEKEVAPGTLRIAGFNIDDEFEDIAARLGKATVAERSFQEQVCYVSTDAKHKVYLIFEVDELGSNFYLFSGGEAWRGRNLCRKTSQVSVQTHTASGLRLGLLPSEVQLILGPPDAVAADRFAYSRVVQHHTSAAEFARRRKMYPDSSDQQAHAELDTFEQYIDIDIRFTDSRLSYLSVSVSGGN